MIWVQTRERKYIDNIGLNDRPDVNDYLDARIDVALNAPKVEDRSTMGRILTKEGAEREIWKRAIAGKLSVVGRPIGKTSSLLVPLDQRPLLRLDVSFPTARLRPVKGRVGPEWVDLTWEREAILQEWPEIYGAWSAPKQPSSTETPTPSPTNIGFGRKPGGNTRIKEIFAELDAILTAEGTENYRGRFTSIARRIQAKFPDYSQNHIEKTLRPTYKEKTKGK